MNLANCPTERARCRLTSPLISCCLPSSPGLDDQNRPSAEVTLLRDDVPGTSYSVTAEPAPLIDGSTSQLASTVMGDPAADLAGDFSMCLRT